VNYQCRPVNTRKYVNSGLRRSEITIESRHRSWQNAGAVSHQKREPAVLRGMGRGEGGIGEDEGANGEPGGDSAAAETGAVTQSATCGPP